MQDAASWDPSKVAETPLPISQGLDPPSPHLLASLTTCQDPAKYAVQLSVSSSGQPSWSPPQQLAQHPLSSQQMYQQLSASRTTVYQPASGTVTMWVGAATTPVLQMKKQA